MYYFLRRDGILYFKEVSFCIGETKEKKIKLSFEHTDYKWLNYEDAYKQLIYRNSKRVLRKANRFIS